MRLGLAILGVGIIYLGFYLQRDGFQSRMNPYNHEQFQSSMNPYKKPESSNIVNSYSPSIAQGIEFMRRA
jgi:hypothetical protein